MNYPYLTSLNLLGIVIFSIVGSFIFALLIKKWSGEKIKNSIKAIGFYLLASILIYFIYPYPWMSNLSGVQGLIIIDYILYSLLLFLAFYFITKRILNISLKKTIGVFLLVIMIAFPVLGLINQTTLNLSENIKLVQQEAKEMREDLMSEGEGGDLFFKVGEIGTAMFSWQTSRLLEAIIKMR